MTMAAPAPEDVKPAEMPLAFRDAMRQIAASVMLVTGRDVDGEPHGMVASSVIPVSMDPPSMLVAVNRNAGLHPVLRRTQRFCVNLLGDHQHTLLLPFSQTALRDQRFAGDGWSGVRSTDAERLPWLPGAPAVIDCTVETEVDYGTHTVFIGRVTSVRCEQLGAGDCLPLVWLAGQRAGLTPTT
jgi:flavin reductase (DIM6/NTAB) family NADH-FMN oxidoreductase RutF